LNVTAPIRQAIMRTPWYAKRKSYRVLFWREITPLAVPIFLENTCVLLMGVLSTFLVSWLGKEAMAGVGLADSFNMVVMSFFAAIDLGQRLSLRSVWENLIPNALVRLPDSR
jgi:Na+-driven multidrug efflux pump